MEETQAEIRVRQELCIHLLGGFSVSVGEVHIPEAQWKSRRACNLVKLLALSPGHRLHRDQVIDTFWPNSDFSAAINNFHQTLFVARRTLETAGANVLAMEDGFLRLAQVEDQALTVDLEEFESAAELAKGSPDPQAYQDALALYTGDLLPEDLYEEWTIPLREALRLTYLQLLLNLAQLHETRQEYPQGIAVFKQLLSRDQSHEEAHAGLMRLYALSGQRQQALRQYQTFCDVLRQELETEPSQSTTRLYEEIQSGRLSPAMPSPAIRHHNLPAQLTTFIGREDQIEQIKGLVRDHRLVTLIGAGGTGKTRLALKAGEKLLENFNDGIFLVELAPLFDPGQVPNACLKALHVIEQSGDPSTQILAHYLENKDLLLILDNCEHVIATCTRLADALLRSCPRLHILATSREVLSVPGESTFYVPPLTFPDPYHLPELERIRQYEAIRLFVERVGQVLPGFLLTAENANAAAQICQRLDGIPLAIELAAARARMMTIEQIAARLDNTFHLLTGGSRAVLPRHQTLKAMVDWSYDLLSPKERLLLQRLSVFAGGWTLEAAETVCADESAVSGHLEEQLDSLEILDLLLLLVDKSLVTVDRGQSEIRYRMLEVIRQYAYERLLEAGNSEWMRERHLAYFCHLSGQAEPHFRGKGMLEWLSRFDAELDNVRAALAWSLAEDVVQGLKLMCNLMWHFHLRSRFIESKGWLEKLLAVESAHPRHSTMENERALQRARGLCTLAFVNINLIIYGNEGLCEESISILRQLGPLGRRELGIALVFKIAATYSELTPAEKQEMLEILQEGNEKFYMSEYLFEESNMFPEKDLELRIELAEESLSICREIEDNDGICSRANLLGNFALAAGEYDRAEALYTEALWANQRVGNLFLENIVSSDLANLDLVQGQYETAALRYKMILKTFQEMNHRFLVASTLSRLMIIAWAQADYPQALHLGREVIQNYPDISYIQAITCIYLGRLALEQGNYIQAKALLKRSISQASQNIHCVRKFLTGWATVLAQQGLPQDSARVLGSANYIYEFDKYWLTPRERREHDETLTLVRTGLGEESFAAAWSEGQAMNLEQAINAALDSAKE